MSDDQTKDPQTEAETKPTEITQETAPEGISEAPPETKSETASEPVAEAPVADGEPAEPSSSGVESVEPAEGSEPVEPAFKAKLINIDALHAGQTVRVHERIVDISPKGEERQRIQIFEGMILGLSGAGISRTMTVRKVSGGIGVEKIYPINSPVVAKIELVKTARVRRAKLSFLTNLRERFSRKFKETYVEDKS